MRETSQGGRDHILLQQESLCLHYQMSHVQRELRPKVSGLL